MGSDPLRAIYYDTETTGIDPKRERIVEIAAYDPAQDRQFVQLVNPGIPIPKEASAVHHITDDMVAEAPSFAEVAPQFAKFCAGNTVLIAHNNDGFDIHFLREEFARAESEMPPWKFLDSLKWARRYRGDLPRHSLQFLREIYGIAANNAHRALDDVIVLQQVFERMIDDLPMEQVFVLMQQKKALTRMPFGKHQGVPLEKVPPSYFQWLAKSGALDKANNAELKERLETLELLPT